MHQIYSTTNTFKDLQSQAFPTLGGSKHCNSHPYYKKAPPIMYTRTHAHTCTPLRTILHCRVPNLHAPLSSFEHIAMLQQAHLHRVLPPGDFVLCFWSRILVYLFFKVVSLCWNSRACTKCYLQVILFCYFWSRILVYLIFKVVSLCWNGRACTECYLHVILFCLAVHFWYDL